MVISVLGVHEQEWKIETSVVRASDWLEVFQVW